MIRSRAAVWTFAVAVATGAGGVVSLLAASPADASAFHPAAHAFSLDVVGTGVTLNVDDQGVQTDETEAADDDAVENDQGDATENDQGDATETGQSDATENEQGDATEQGDQNDQGDATEQGDQNDQGD